MKKYRVSLPITLSNDVNGTVHRPGAIVELDDATAKLYAHALIALPEEKEEGENGRTNS